MAYDVAAEVDEKAQLDVREGGAADARHQNDRKRPRMPEVDVNYGVVCTEIPPGNASRRHRVLGSVQLHRARVEQRSLVDAVQGTKFHPARSFAQHDEDQTEECVHVQVKDPLPIRGLIFADHVLKEN
eukprot:CAMPEP_0198204916 /NCGR_PEP_ID=MMETSP1445-20131203/8397_1 /TAXON_ID=36898 /ORGANISM="Pyramimonas sp., Strain CCMP2087" /LENGTH=127 /DNA_ID=CAMNT_0043877007 /DNA_START=532 /DNA_END=914 /DNA_ORIENTATION=-